MKMDNEMQSNETAGDISAIEQTPGFLLPDTKGQFLRDINRPEYDRLEAKRDAAYRQAKENGPEVINGSTEFETVAEAEAAAESLRPAQSNAASLQEQAELFGEAQNEMNKLVDLGFDSAEITHDIPKWKVDSWKMQRLNAEQNFTELIPIIEKQFTSLDAPSGNLALLRAFNQAELSPEVREKHIELIIADVHEANKQKHESVI